jgi:hypothetical protein
VKALVEHGYPEEMAELFASVEVEVLDAHPPDYRYRLVYPHGEVRETELAYHAAQARTPLETDWKLPDGSLSLVREIEPESSLVHFEHFVPDEALPAELTAALDTSASGTSAARAAPTWRTADAEPSEQAVPGGTLVYFQETGKEGTKALAGAVAEHFEAPKTGVALEVLGAGLEVYEAAQAGEEVRAWLDEVDVLMACAKSPTNALAMQDPDYSANAVKLLSDTRRELQVISGIRFLSMMDSTALGLVPALAVATKPIFVWNDETIKGLAAELLRVARQTVVACEEEEEEEPGGTGQTADPETVEHNEGLGIQCDEAAAAELPALVQRKLRVVRGEGTFARECFEGTHDVAWSLSDWLPSLTVADSLAANATNPLAGMPLVTGAITVQRSVVESRADPTCSCTDDGDDWFRIELSADDVCDALNVTIEDYLPGCATNEGSLVTTVWDVTAADLFNGTGEPHVLSLDGSFDKPSVQWSFTLEVVPEE